MKKYISILELFPKIIDRLGKEAVLGYPSRPYGHFFLVEDTDDGINKQLRFLNVYASRIAIAGEGNEPVSDSQAGVQPFQVGYAYVVPHILEFEVIKHHYQDTLNEEILGFIEALLYQYYMMFNLAENTRFYSYGSDLIDDKSTDGPLYTISEGLSHELDLTEENSFESVMEIITAAYDHLNTLKPVTATQRKALADMMPIERNLKTLIPYVKLLNESGYYSSHDVRRSKILPLLALFAVLDSQAGVFTNPTYSEYISLVNEFFHRIPSRTSIQNQGVAPTLDVDHTFFSAGIADRGHTVYDFQDIEGPLYDYLTPHILKHLRTGFFPEKTVTLDSTEYDNFSEMPWEDGTVPAIILNNSRLSWDEGGE